MFYFLNFTFSFHGFSLKKLNWRREENLVVNNKDNRVFMSRNYRSDSCPLEIYVLKTSIFALEASLPGQMFQGHQMFKEHQISAGQLSADSSSTETLYCLYCSPLNFLQADSN